MTRRRPLVLTMGEPAGIAPEITVAAWRALRAEGLCFAYLGDPAILDAPLRAISSLAEAPAVFGEALPVLPIRLPGPPVPGRTSPAHAPAVIGAIRDGVALCLAGEAAALVTNPIQKSALMAAGFAHPGHTEFLAELCGGAEPLMMLAIAGLRTVPVTIHVPLAEALALLSTDRIVATGRAAAAALRRDFGLAAPRLAIAGLNPHAGESGRMGREEIEIIAPAVVRLRAEGIDALGPMPPDSMFSPGARAGYDCAICMYHDQALIPIKALDMAGGVNITCGLPILRTSPDHGTALDIAGTSRADPASLIAALRLAADLAARRSAPAA